MKKNKEFLKWLKTRPGNKAFLLTNRCDPDDYDYADYVEDCETNDTEPEPEGSEAFINWCYQSAENSFQDDISNMSCSWAEKNGYLITGSLGLWDGNHEVVPQLADSFEDVISKVMGKDECYVDADYDTECIHISVSHHDGVNRFNVYVLREGVDKEKVRELVDEGKMDLTLKYYKRFVCKIEDFLF